MWMMGLFLVSAEVCPSIAWTLLRLGVPWCVCFAEGRSDWNGELVDCSLNICLGLLLLVVVLNLWNENWEIALLSSLVFLHVLVFRYPQDPSPTLTSSGLIFTPMQWEPCLEICHQPR